MVVVESVEATADKLEADLFEKSLLLSFLLAD